MILQLAGYVSVPDRSIAPQLNHWPEHKGVCKRFQEAKDKDAEKRRGGATADAEVRQMHALPVFPRPLQHPEVPHSRYFPPCRQLRVGTELDHLET